MAVTQQHLTMLHQMLVDYAYNALSGQAVKQQELLNFCADVEQYCLSSQWGTMDPNYRSAWQGEIVRRLDLIIPDPTAIVSEPKGKPGITQGKIADIFSAGALTVIAVKFSQFTINRHFQGQYVGQPSWLSGKEITEVAKTLRQEPLKSSDLRLRFSYSGGQWLALNNRGFALHCLANVPVRRMVFDADLSSDESGRLGTTLESKHLNLGSSVPASRRGKADWDAQIPSTFTAVPETKNSTQVLYTIKAMKIVPNPTADLGNETVFNSG